MQTLEEVGEWEDAAEHAEIEQGGGPGKALCGDCGWGGIGVEDDREGEVFGHAEDRGTAKDSL